MNIDKNMILDLLRSRGDQDKAAQAEQELPDQVDPKEHGALLKKFGVDPGDLGGKLGGKLGGLKKMFGK